MRPCSRDTVPLRRDEDQHDHDDHDQQQYQPRRSAVNMAKRTSNYSMLVLITIYMTGLLNTRLDDRPARDRSAVRTRPVDSACMKPP